MKFDEWREQYFNGISVPQNELRKAYNAFKRNIAVYAISADPPTWGHADIMMRASKKFEKIYWVVGVNSKKEAAFTPEEKLEMMKHYVDFYKLNNVMLNTVEGSIAKFARSVKASILIRGLRSSSDYQYEYELSVGNRGICKGIETVCMFSKPHYATISSSIVRELASLNEKISQYLHPDVEKIVKSKLRRS